MLQAAIQPTYFSAESVSVPFVLDSKGCISRGQEQKEWKQAMFEEMSGVLPIGRAFARSRLKAS